MPVCKKKGKKHLIRNVRFDFKQTLTKTSNPFPRHKSLGFLSAGSWGVYNEQKIKVINILSHL